MAREKNTHVKETSLRCSECNHVTRLWRSGGRMKKRDHTKDLHCVKCNKTTAHKELKLEEEIPAWIREFQERHDIERGDR
ncbi:hypothetical protein BCPG3_036 [Bacillus phage BCPG3]|uniref:Uncharacterized protein n=3 Tax=Wphvirus TaxID=1922327 RepID=W5QUH1_9CAUD|nr:hypothetical protein BPS13_0016 [Bacillus phage BPS13]YP_009002902.1 hypothetical protein BPS10C_016 [Bacillus phage BPS10C]YP_009282015.1 hypothetical protein SALINJAH_61 [Bacillus phage SalinJah]QQO38968.1 hypothetical protein BCPG1_237 [Bacillus phage BCPG1]QSJ04353.1 hypothetical protein BCPG3_036 [Bacillus phage BCPG3]QSJ04565.1 hypothetical protein BCP18_033 [Bacillus phage BCP18]AEZ50195.1 hypothetical protein BPS13_0016 [Bacillus phage BPS13]AGI12013.1 hypothetical protein BPS10C_